MSISGKVVEILYLTEESLMGPSFGGVVEAQIHLQGEYGLQKFTIINPLEDMDFLMGKQLWGNASDVMFGQTKIAERRTTATWIMLKGWEAIFKELHELDLIGVPPPRRRIIMED